MKSVLIYSGGLDSTVLLYKLSAENSVAEALSVNYGQKQIAELDFAVQNCKKLGIKHTILDLSGVSGVFGKSALTDKNTDIPLAEYSAENMAQTVVPNRNMLLLAFATARAIAVKAQAVAYAAHGGDHAIYADCRPEFADALAKAIALADDSKIALLRPFVNMTKAEIVEQGAKLNVDFSQTWSCYKGGEIHCGKCATCLERKEAFVSANIPDPTVYEKA